ncbi:Putative transposase [Nannocystis exedens]|uniref:Putative transposase n=1 Tax=Nannocystis exedens TaxID=54 RepID=A0A1I1XF89_9BACT|nr:transposase zinc-binding domain-containing protein [Nannocystis exedens]PCC73459.1 transposase [Nannocystis exedens]SFE05992.1 Putative transposase [Nannocystis exedens]
MASFARRVPGEWRLAYQNGTSQFDTWHWGPGKYSLRVLTGGTATAGEPWRELQLDLKGHESDRVVPLVVRLDFEADGTVRQRDWSLVRTACRTCGDELRVPFARRGRGFCPSCMGRRMAEGAALLVDHVLPAVGYRQWVLSFQGPLAVRLGYDTDLLAAVCEKLARAVVQDMRRAVKQLHSLASVTPLRAGVMVAVQRFRSDLGLYVHLHGLVTDGVFEDLGEGMRFLHADPPTPARMTASPQWKIRGMLGWFSADRILAARRNRITSSSPGSALRSTLRATSRDSRRSEARWTIALAPTPMTWSLS